MQNKLIAVGISLLIIWGALTFISLGLPSSVCDTLKRATFGFLDGAIDNARNGFFYDVDNQDMPTVLFFFIFSIAFLLYFWASIFVLKFPPKNNILLIVITFSILLRIILIPGYAIHENDFYRYLWDGKVLKSGINPYKYAPGDLESLESGYSRDVYDLDKKEIVKTKIFSAEENDELARIDVLRKGNITYFGRIGHRWVPTIYPPVAQLIFALSSAIKEDSILLVKTIIVIFDILTLLVIVALLRHLRKNPSLVIIYGWSPLVLKEIANSAHYDSIPIFLMLLALYLVFTNRLFLGSVSLALAVCAKFFPAVLIPLFVKRFKLRYNIVLALTILLLYIPFFIWGAVGAKGVFKGLLVYSEKWAYNGSIFVLFESFFNAFNIRLINQFFLPKLIVGCLFIIVMLYLSKRDDFTEHALMFKSSAAVAFLFLLSPVGDPWYFCWVIPFLCFFTYRSLIILSWLLIFSYLSFSRDIGVLSLGNLEIPVLNMIQYIPFYILFISEIIRRRKGKLIYAGE